MKITNKYSINRTSKKDKFNAIIINFKKYIRSRTQWLKPYSKYEELIYGDVKVKSKAKYKIEKGKFLDLEKIIMLNLVSKVNSDKLYNGIENLFINNPLKGCMSGQLYEDRLKECIKRFSLSKNYQNWSFLCSISPTDEELHSIVDFITIEIFNFSNDYIGISFNLNLTEDAKKELYDKMNEEVYGRRLFKINKYRKRKQVYIWEQNPLLTREENIEDYLIEIKYKFQLLFEKYLPLELSYNDNVPISLNIYKTNYNLKEDKSNFLGSMGLFSNFALQEIKDVFIINRKKNKGDSFIKTKMWYELKVRCKKLDRSNNVFYYSENRNYEILDSGSSYINFCLLSLGFYRLEDMVQELTIERNRLYNCKPSKTKKINKQYEKMNSNFQKYKMTFSGIKYYNHTDIIDNYMKKGTDNLKKQYEKLFSQYKEINEEYSNRMNINNSRSAFYFSVVSIVLALLALGLTIYLEYRPNHDKCINTCVKE